MKNKLIQDINNYIKHLNESGLFVSVHGKAISGLLEHNIHNNPYCTFVKTDNEAWEKCIKCQQKVFASCNNDHLFGMCHAGVEEYVFYVDDKTFISVSGYGINEKKANDRMNRLSDEFSIDRSTLSDIYRKSLKHRQEDISELKTLIYPICHMLRLLQLTLGEASESQTESKIFDSILSYVQRNITQNITIRDISYACSCSESTVSHLFKKYTKSSVKQYILEARIKQAKKLLISSDMSITDIALLCGFSDSNYFTAFFKKAVGKAPTVYRAEG